MKPLFRRVDPSFFHGAAIAAGLGLALGLALHGPWQDDAHGGGPHLLVSSAQAAEAPRPIGESDIVSISPPAEDAPAFAETAYADVGQLPPNPLPVTRLAGRGGAPLPASANVERVSAEEVATIGDFKGDDAPTEAPSGR